MASDKPQWNSYQQNLDAYRLTPEEIMERKLLMKSKNHGVAVKDLAARRLSIPRSPTQAAAAAAADAVVPGAGPTFGSAPTGRLPSTAAPHKARRSSAIPRPRTRSSTSRPSSSRGSRPSASGSQDADVAEWVKAKSLHMAPSGLASPMAKSAVVVPTTTTPHKASSASPASPLALVPDFTPPPAATRAAAAEPAGLSAVLSRLELLTAGQEALHRRLDSMELRLSSLEVASRDEDHASAHVEPQEDALAASRSLALVSERIAAIERRIEYSTARATPASATRGTAVSSLVTPPRGPAVNDSFALSSAVAERLSFEDPATPSPATDSKSVRRFATPLQDTGFC